MNMLQKFFDKLDDRLDSARKVEERLGKEVAHHFNVLNYLDTREIGLSYIIGDLLDPRGNHGQGPFFLEMLLEKLGKGPREHGLNLKEARVFREYKIKGDRLIDIYIEIPSSDGEYCLAFENKPWAEDQKDQVSDYLNYLCGKYEKNRFWLIYLSPRGEPPTEYSLRKEELKNGQWEDHLMVMAYIAYTGRFIGEDEFRDYRTPCTFVDWITVCHDKCRVDKLRWFLRDIESYCKKVFGDQTMPNDFETETIKDFLIEDADRLGIARQVSDSWPAVRGQVCREFLEHLRSRFEDKMNEPELLDECGEVQIELVEKYTWAVGISLSGLAWNTPGHRYPAISIRLEFESKPGRYDNSFFSVYSPSWKPGLTANDEFRKNLEGALNRDWRPQNAYSQYPWWQYASDDYVHWNSLVPELHRESQIPGKITEYFVNQFVGIVRVAIPIINNLNT